MTPEYSFFSTSYLIASPLEQFEVIPLIGLFLGAPILGLKGLSVSLTNLSLYAILTATLVLGFHILAKPTHLDSNSSPSFLSTLETRKTSSKSSSNDYLLVPSKWSLFTESSYSTLHSMVKEQVGNKGELYLPFIYSIFFFILIANLVGNVPYSFALGTSAVVSLGLSFTIFFGVTSLAMYRHRIHFLSYFVPSGTPGSLVPLLILIELISYIARAFSLGVRLFSNLVSGHTLLKILSGMLYPILTSGILLFIVTLLPLTIFIALVGLEIAVSVIQAYVFTILLTSYLKDALDLH